MLSKHRHKLVGRAPRNLNVVRQSTFTSTSISAPTIPTSEFCLSVLVLCFFTFFLDTLARLQAANPPASSQLILPICHHVRAPTRHVLLQL